MVIGFTLLLISHLIECVYTVCHRYYDTYYNLKELRINLYSRYFDFISVFIHNSRIIILFVIMATSARVKELQRIRGYKTNRVQNCTAPVGNNYAVGNTGKEVHTVNKITNKWISEFKKYIKEKETRIYALTKKDLVEGVNYRLDEEYRIGYDSFRYGDKDKYKQAIIGEFVKVYGHYLRKKKEELIEKLRDSSKWAREAWMVERLYSEWNLQHKNENVNVNVNMADLLTNLNKSQEVIDSTDDN